MSSSIWTSFLPYTLTDDLARHPGQNPVGREQRFQAVTLFVDITGFTSMSEALAATGKAGAEELTAILNSYFEPMITLIQSYGGIIGKFGGDAMLVLFPAYGRPQRAMRRAVQCALDIQMRMDRYAALKTSVGTYGLSMRTGLAYGRVLNTTVGDLMERLEYIIAGGALDDCTAAEHRARPGQVVAHESLMAQLPNVVAEKKEDGFWLVKGLKRRARAAEMPALPELSFPVTETIAAFLHPSIAARLRQDLTSFINEHRKVTTLFMQFRGFDYDQDPEVGEKLQNYLSQVIYTIRHYDGYLNKVEMGDKGSKCLVVFGAPIAHEDDVERALNCAIELSQMMQVPVRIGISTGFVYCGQVGSAVRQEYTVMGDHVNLAARLMQAAREGQILVNEETHALAPEAFTWQSGQELMVKGRQEPVQVYTLLGMKKQASMHLQEPQYSLPMVGRSAEISRVRSLLELAKSGQGQILGITAEAGMGKSRLTAEVIRLAREMGLEGLGGECVSHGTTTSYLVWRNVLGGLFGLEPSETPEQQVRCMRNWLEHMAPDLLPRLPLLGQALNLPAADNEWTAAMDARLRKASLEALVVDVLRAHALSKPTLLVLEDCHWIDPVSNELLEAVGRSIMDLPVLMVVVYRPPEREHIHPRVTRFAHFHEMRLTDFTPAEMQILIQLKLQFLYGSAVQISEKWFERLVQRAQGNPFYIEEMINLLRDREIDPTNAEALESFDLPDSLNSLIISRIDRLEEDAKITLKVASVIGRVFRASWLWGIYPQFKAPERVREQLDQLCGLDFTPLDKPAPELEYLFKHIVTREVAYESLALSTRRQLHEQAGRYIEQTYADQIERYLDLLAYHFGLSENRAKQREYFYRAGIAAQAVFANAAAIEYYRHAAPLLEAHEKPELLLRLGGVLELTGNWKDAEATYLEAEKVAEDLSRQVDLARCWLVRATLERRKGHFEPALMLLEKARTQFETLDDVEGVSDVLRDTGVVHWSQGAYPRALACFEECRNRAISTGDRKRLFRALGNIGLIHDAQGDPQQALRSYEDARKIALEIDDKLGANTAVGNMGNAHLTLGHYPQALACHTEKLTSAIELGYQLGVGIAVGNMGLIYFERGDFSSALQCYTLSLKVGLLLGDRLGVAIALWNVARVQTAEKNHTDAMANLQRAIEIGRAIDTPYELCEFLYTQAELHLTCGNLLQARGVNGQALDMSAEVERDYVRIRALLLEREICLAMGEISRDEALQSLEALLPGWQGDEDQAAIHYYCWRVNPAQETHRQAAAGLYGRLFEATPNMEYAQRHWELTGQRLPDAPLLDPLPEVVTRALLSLDTLVMQVDALVKQMD